MRGFFQNRSFEYCGLNTWMCSGTEREKAGHIRQETRRWLAAAESAE